MNKSFLLGIGALAFTSLIVSCGDELGTTAAKGNGRILPDVQLNTETVKARSASVGSRAEDEASAKAIEADDLSIRLSKTDNSRSWDWEKLSDFPSEQDFPIGQYEIEAYYGDPAKQGFDMPAYSGSQTITVKDGETTPVSIEATLANSMVQIEYTDAFRKYMQSWSATVNDVEYGQDETRPVYVTPGDVQINISIVKANGKSATVSLDPVEAEARNLYAVKVDIEGGAGDAVLKITFDERLEEDVVEIDLSDKLLSTPEPVITPKGFESDNAIEVVTGLTPDMDLSMSLVAMAGLKSVNMHTVSTSLVKQGWPEDIDLMAATAEQQQVLTVLGLKVVGLWKTPGEMAVLDFSNVVAHISAKAGDNANLFTVTVKDKLMRESEAVVLNLDVRPIELSIASTGQKYVVGRDYSFILDFNGSDAKNNVTVQCKDATNMWRNIAIKDVQPYSRGTESYLVTITPTVNRELVVRALCGDVISNEVNFGSAPAVDVDELNVFSTYAYARITGKYNSLDGLTFSAAKNGESTYNTVSATPQNGYYRIEGLTPNTPYSLRAKVDGEDTPVVEFTTEDATDVPNGHLDQWTSSEVTEGAMKCTVWDCTGWATMNPYTTAYLTSGTNYSALSSTLPENNAQDGQGAQIRTVGFDFSAASAGLNNFKKSSQGELFLGTYSGGPVYGIPFGSRPQSMSFYYKYTPQNAADQGYAEITMLDGEGNEIAKSTLDLPAANSYTLQTLDLNYPLNSQKASKIIVVFRSTNAGDKFLTSADIPKHANWLGILTDYYTGSKLYVDEIQLNY